MESQVDVHYRFIIPTHRVKRRQHDDVSQQVSLDILIQVADYAVSI